MGEEVERLGVSLEILELGLVELVFEFKFVLFYVFKSSRVFIFFFYIESFFIKFLISGDFDLVLFSDFIILVCVLNKYWMFIMS